MSEVTKISKKTPRSITDNLSVLRGKISRWFLVHGASRILLALLVLCALSFGIDRFMHMDLAQRGVMLVLGIGIVVWTVWSKLIRPLLSRLSDDALILEVENQTPEAKEELITALEFSRMDWSAHPNVSKGMVANAIEQGSQLGSDFDFSKIIRSGRFLTNCLLLLMLGVIAIIGAVMIPQSVNLKVWFNRNILLGNAQWPQDYFFDVDGVVDGKMNVPRGDDWPIIAKVSEGYLSLPEGTEIEFRSDGGGSRTATMVPGAEGDVFFHTLRSVTEEYEFRIRSKKVTSDWVKIAIIERPTIEEIVLVQTPPEYTGEEASALEHGSGPYDLLRGSQLSVRGRASKSLSEATLQVGELLIPVTVDGQSFSGAITTEELTTGRYVLHIQDQEEIVTPDPSKDSIPKGLSPREPIQFKIRLREDTAPEIEFALRGVSNMIVPRARLPYRASIQDDYGITEILFGYEVKADRAEEDTMISGEFTPTGIAASLGEQLITIEDYIEIEPLAIPVDSRLSLTMNAVDNDAVTEGGVKTGSSTTILLRIVSESELRADLLRREKEQRQVLSAIFKAEDGLLTETQAFLAETRKEEELSKEQLSSLVKLQRIQKRQGTALKAISGRIDAMVAEVQNNRLEEEDGALKRRLRTKVLNPMRKLWEEMIPVVSQQLERVRRVPDDIELRNGILEDSIVRQQAIIANMKKILASMVEDEDFHQAVNLLYEMQKLQLDLQTKTEDEKEARLKALMEAGNK